MAQFLAQFLAPLFGFVAAFWLHLGCIILAPDLCHVLDVCSGFDQSGQCISWVVGRCCSENPSLVGGWWLVGTPTRKH